MAEQYSGTANKLVKAYAKRNKEIMSDIEDLDDTTETDMDDHRNITAMNSMDQMMLNKTN